VSSHAAAEVLESISDAFYAVDAEFRFVYVNRKAEQLWGRKREELLGRHFWTEFPQAIGSDSYRMHLKAMTERAPVQYEAVSPLILRWIDASIYPAANGGLTCYFRDISDRKQAEARDRFLIALDDAVRPLTNASAITATAACLLAEHLDVSRCAYGEVNHDAGALDIVGSWSRGLPDLPARVALPDLGAAFVDLSLTNKPFVIGDVDRDPRIGDVRHSFRAIGMAAVIAVPLHKDGRFVAGMAVHSAAPRTWTAAEVELVRLVASRCWEFIERARVSTTLREREEHLRLIFANVKDHAIVTLDTDGCVTAWNSGAERLFGYTPDDVVGRPRTVLFASDDTDQDREGMQVDHGPMAAGIDRIRTHVRKDGTLFHGSDTTEVLRDDAGRLRGFVKVIRDVSEQKRIEEQRERLLETERAARSAAERVARMKDEFLATISHELRTPLNAILGWTHILFRGGRPVDDSMREGLTVIERNARAQAQLVDDLLDVSRIATGRVRLDIQPVQLPGLIDAALDAVRPAAEAKGIVLHKRVASGTMAVSGDPNRLQQVFWNLLTNAVKFTSNGGRIDVSVQFGGSSVEVCVTDTGQGIKSEFLPYVFDRFRQADASTKRTHTGLGLGLAIVHELVELHGGTVKAESHGEGTGSMFTVTLPLRTAAAEVRVDPPQHSDRGAPAMVAADVDANGPVLNGVRILVVEDEPDARAIIQRVLEESDAKVDVADSVRTALTQFHHMVPDVLVSDIGMPHQDGYELIARVRSLSAQAGGGVPAVALTAFARPEDRRRAVEAGYQIHLSKPVEPRALVAAIRSLIVGARSSVPSRS
jgi:PAS domain S-box-containing protein